MTAPIAPIARIGILEDDEALRAYIDDVIGTTEHLEIAFSVGTLAQAYSSWSVARADLALIDLQLPDGHGIDFVRHIKASSNAKCLILTVLGDRTSVFAALQAGADGYLLKDTPADQLRANVLKTLHGETPISPQVATFLLDMWRGAAPQVARDQSEGALTGREVDVLKLFSRGLSYRETADTLGLSQHTIGDYVKSIYNKLGVHSRTEAIFEARQVGLISPLD